MSKREQMSFRSSAGASAPPATWRSLDEKRDPSRKHEDAISEGSVAAEGLIVRNARVHPTPQRGLDLHDIRVTGDTIEAILPAGKIPADGRPELDAAGARGTAVALGLNSAVRRIAGLSGDTTSARRGQARCETPRLLIPLTTKRRGP